MSTTAPPQPAPAKQPRHKHEWLNGRCTGDGCDSKLSKLSERMGRPTKYEDALIPRMIEYFDVRPYKTQVVSKETVTAPDGTKTEKEDYKEVAVDLPMMTGFAHTCGLSRRILSIWAKDGEPVGSEKHTFFLAYKTCLEIQERILVLNGLRGNYANAGWIFTAKNVLRHEDNTHWSDRREVLVDDKSGDKLPEGEKELDEFITKRYHRLDRIKERVGEARAGRSDRRTGSAKVAA